MLFASGLYSERARRATKTPPEGGVGVGSDLYNGVSRSNDRQAYTLAEQGIHDPRCREVLSHNGVSHNNDRRIYATAEKGMHDRGCYNIRTSYTLSRVL